MLTEAVLMLFEIPENILYRERSRVWKFLNVVE